MESQQSLRVNRTRRRRFSVYIVPLLLCVLMGYKSHAQDTDYPLVSESQIVSHVMELYGRNCTPASIEQFPRPVMDLSTRRHGGFLVHSFISVYMFVALAIVCDDYFVPSLERISAGLNLQPDVAGATFMAAGSSAPELATSIIGVFIAKDDIGLGTVIGSAVFNIMFVVSVCGIGATIMCVEEIRLNWWPLVRDCGFYLISIALLLFVIYDERVEWYEAMALVIVYVIYCVFMYFNPVFERWANSLKCSCWTSELERTQLVSYGKYEDNPTGGGDESDGLSSTGKASDDVLSKIQDNEPPFARPIGFWRTIYWLLVFPLHFVFYLTVPDCRKRRWGNWFIITFIMSLAWLAVFSYLLVWMITILGQTWGVPDTVMGLTFLAAGVSIPDAISSLIVVREGQGDMAVSNAVGSNVFDILICLGVPWLLQTALIQPNSSVNVISKGLTYSTISLLSTVFFLLLSVHLNKWRLNRQLGIILMVWYLMFMVLASMYELNVFGDFNPPTCPSDY